MNDAPPILFTKSNIVFVFCQQTEFGSSAYGGKWKPSKPDDERFLGNPGDINRSGEKETHIGDDGKADRERHNTTNPNPKYHTSPHDHDVYWDEWGPHLGPAINYPDGAPAFKRYRSCYMSERMISRNTPEENRFKTISDFKHSLKLGGEVIFLLRSNQNCHAGVPPAAQISGMGRS